MSQEGESPLGVTSVFPICSQSLLFFVGSTSQAGSVASFLSAAVIKHSDRRQLGGGKHLHGLHIQVIIHHHGWSEQELNQELEAETVGGEGRTSCWLILHSLDHLPKR